MPEETTTISYEVPNKLFFRMKSLMILKKAKTWEELSEKLCDENKL